jgi:hypothetical protein
VRQVSYLHGHRKLVSRLRANSPKAWVKFLRSTFLILHYVIQFLLYIKFKHECIQRRYVTLILIIKLTLKKKIIIIIIIHNNKYVKMQSIQHVDVKKKEM